MAEPSNVMSAPPLASSRPAPRLSWPPPRLPPRVGSGAGSDAPLSATESSAPPGADSPFFDSQFSLSASRTPSGEIRISQIRDLLFGDVQQQYDQRLTNLEAQLELLQAEARTRLGVMESSVVGEIGGAISSLTGRVMSNEAAAHEEGKRLDERVSALEDIFGSRIDSVEQEVRALRSDLDALTEGVRLEVKATNARFAEVMRSELDAMVTQRIHQEVGHLFLALGSTLKKRSQSEAGAPHDAERADAEAPTTLPASAPSEPATSARDEAPTGDEPSGVVQLSAAAVSITAEALTDDGPGHAEIERWAEELSSGDIPILDPFDDNRH